MKEDIDEGLIEQGLDNKGWDVVFDEIGYYEWVVVNNGKGSDEGVGDK